MNLHEPCAQLHPRAVNSDENAALRIAGGLWREQRFLTRNSESESR